MDKLVVILRGIPGSGKSTFARSNYPKGLVVSADDFFMKSGKYQFNPELLGLAHRDCFRKFLVRCDAGEDLIVVDNTNSSAVEAAPYVLCGESFGYRVEVITLLCDPVAAAKRNVHGVPEDRVVKMDHYLRLEKLPPWWSHRTVKV